MAACKWSRPALIFRIGYSKIYNRFISIDFFTWTFVWFSVASYAISLAQKKGCAIGSQNLACAKKFHSQP